MDESTRPDGRLTRRGLLSLVGASALAGCGGFGGLTGDSEPTIRAFDLPDIDRESVPEPIVAPSVPVDIAPSHLETARARTTNLLAELPTPLTEAAIPNGYVRNELTDAADDATDELDQAQSARTELVALESLRQAREHARFAATGWAVADRGATATPLREEHQRAVADARSVRDEYEYHGDNPVRATLVHATVERALHRAVDESFRPHEDGELLPVAEWGEAAESVRAQLDDAQHLATQFRASLPDDAGTVRQQLEGAAETLFADARDRRSALPPEPTPGDRGVAERTIGDLRRAADDDPMRVGETIGPASAVVEATKRLAAFRALERVRERIDAGELSAVESAGELQTVRTDAYDALDAALAESAAPELARTVVSDASWRVTRADWELARYTGDVTARELASPAAQYVFATAIARETPDTCEQTVGALDSA